MREAGGAARLRACAILAALAVAWFAATGVPVRAEALPVRVILSHVPVMTTWGPPDATGVAMLVLEEGDVRADFVGLPALGAGERYELWLMRSETGQTLALGRFVVDEDKPVTHVDLLLPQPVPDLGWDTVIVTVEPEPDPEPDVPDPRRVLIGAFPGTPVELDLVPPSLPQTGGGRMPSPGAWGALLGVNLVLVGSLHRVRRWKGAKRNR